MGKRFTGTDIWDQDWYLDLPDEYKLFWKYICDACDHAGLYKVNVRVFNSGVKNPVSAPIALELFNADKARIRVVSPTVWFIEDFIAFQYGKQLNPANKLHLSIIRLLKMFDVSLTSIRGVLDLSNTSSTGQEDLNVGLKDKDKVKDKVNSITIKEGDEVFKKIRHLYITTNEYNRLLETGYTAVQVQNIFDAIENFAGTKKYVSLNLTAQNWLKREYPEVTEKPHAKVTPIYQIEEPLPTRVVKPAF